jgi:hypothetical protein
MEREFQLWVAYLTVVLHRQAGMQNKILSVKEQQDAYWQILLKVGCVTPSSTEKRVDGQYLIQAPSSGERGIWDPVGRYRHTETVYHAEG